MSEVRTNRVSAALFFVILTEVLKGSMVLYLYIALPVANCEYVTPPIAVHSFRQETAFCGVPAMKDTFSETQLILCLYYGLIGVYKHLCLSPDQPGDSILLLSKSSMMIFFDQPGCVLRPLTKISATFLRVQQVQTRSSKISFSQEPFNWKYFYC